MSDTSTSAPLSFGERARAYFALERNVVVLAVATFLFAFGENLWLRFAPRYLEALGASLLVVGAWGSLSDLLDAAWQYPGGALTEDPARSTSSRFALGRKRALLALTALSMVGLALFLVPAWPVVLVGLVFYMAAQAYAQPATFAVIGDALPKAKRAMGFVVQSTLKRVPILIAAPLAGFLITERLGVLTGVRLGLATALVLSAIALVLQARHFRSDRPFRSDRSFRPEARPGRTRLGGVPANLRRLLVSDILVRMGESATKVFIVIWLVNVRGFTDLDFGVMIALMTLVTLAVYIPAGRAADAGKRKPWVALTFLFFTLFPLAFLVIPAGSAPSRFALVALAFVIGGLREIGEPARKASIVDMAESVTYGPLDSARGRERGEAERAAEGGRVRLAGKENRGSIVGTYYAIRGFAIMPVALIAGWLALRDPAAPFWLGGALSGAGLVVYLLTVREE